MTFILGLLAGISGWILSASTLNPLFAYLPIGLMLASTLALHHGLQWQLRREKASPPTEADEVIQRLAHPANYEVMQTQTVSLTILLLLLGAFTGAGLMYLLA